MFHPEPDVTVGWLEDNYHHFGVTLRHEGGVVRAVSSRAVRFPWTTCGGATEVLHAVTGQPLLQRAQDLSRRLGVHDHCTHLFELAALAMSHAARSGPDLRYDASAYHDPKTPERHEVVLRQSGREVQSMEILDRRIAAPSAYAGHHLYEGFREWLAGLPAEEADRLWILRRVFWLAEGYLQFKPGEVAADSGMGAVCYTFQPERRTIALASGTTLDLSDPGIELLAHSREIP
ncbi:hypothetical protein GCM10011371_13960 [Novosphingobium marinum]|uniref:DUF2889 domain-containing protein n=1 Tax=Novosphingobium marinum TaxID=1514948 RepID=A0A7Y9XYX5_9SPHN|nr:DUF2889 domain-containing protein [Novosphingobium marinum]NYH95506.1 hypothetical protein [Novosphingobium marinum]GGC27590.1 hypothetical protein GCM10011371_13960 [Novosphingobium marinum]